MHYIFSWEGSHLANIQRWLKDVLDIKATNERLHNIDLYEQRQKYGKKSDNY